MHMCVHACLCLSMCVCDNSSLGCSLGWLRDTWSSSCCWNYKHVSPCTVFNIWVLPIKLRSSWLHTGTLWVKLAALYYHIITTTTASVLESIDGFAAFSTVWLFPSFFPFLLLPFSLLYLFTHSLLTESILGCSWGQDVFIEKERRGGIIRRYASSSLFHLLIFDWTV